MKFLVDAQLPYQIAVYLNKQRHDAIHTLDLPQKNRTPDKIVRQISIAQRRIVITKDNDFLDSYLIKREPFKILLVTTGNIRNDELLLLFEINLNRLLNELKKNHVVELSRSSIIVHF